VNADVTGQKMRFESLVVGQTFATPRRTVTEADIAAFADLSGDHNPLHTNDQYASQGPYDRCVAHGLLTLAVATGLVMRLGWFERAVLAFRELRCKFKSPVYAGDTIGVNLEVTRMRALPRTGGGLVDLRVHVVNQADELVILSTWRVLMRGGDEGEMSA
jgi:acyl dehydratase